MPELYEIPTSIEFLRDYVAKNMPVVIREGIFSTILRRNMKVINFC